MTRKPMLSAASRRLAGHGELCIQLEEYTSLFQCKKTDPEAAGTLQDNWTSQRSFPAVQATTAGRLNSVPRAGSRQSRLTLYCCSISPALPEVGETTSRAGRGNPTARAPGSGRLVSRTRVAKFRPTCARGQYDHGT